MKCDLFKLEKQSERKGIGMVVIAVIQRSWVLVGQIERDGHLVKLTRAACLRRWGTKKGLGEIAENGPTKDTILDLMHRPVRLHPLQIIFDIECREDRWLQHLPT